MRFYSSTLLPVMKDKQDENEVRKGLLDLLKLVNLAAEPKFGDIAHGDYSEFEDNGFLQVNGSGCAWDDLIAPASNLRPGTTPPTYAAFLGGIFAPRFDAGVSDMVYGSFEMAHDYKQFTDIDFHVHWSPTTTNTGNIVWGIEYTVANINTVFPAPVTALCVPAPAPGVVNKHVLTDIAAIPGAALKIGSIVAYRLFRQNGGTDTFTGNAFLHSVGIHYQIDTLGSRKELEK